MTQPQGGHDARDWVAIILAVGMAVALNVLVLGVMLEARGPTYELSENATQVIIATFGGIVGVLGSYIGFRAGAARAREHHNDEQPAETDEPDLPD